MIEGEGGAGLEADAATLYTIAQRFLFVFRPQGLASTYTDAARLYSQPVNPRWLAGGDKCAGRTSGYCDLEHTSRRARIQGTPWAALPAHKTAAVLAWAAGRLPNPVPGAVDFADAATSTDWLERNPGARVLLRAGNWYMATARSADVAIVEVDPREPSLLLPLALGLGTALALGAAGLGAAYALRGAGGAP
jgi:hypothetical protein